METIVSITPLKVQEDSRTFKIAASFARFGYRSIVVEGSPSSLNKEKLPFELISINAPIGNDVKATNDDFSELGMHKGNILRKITGAANRVLRGILALPKELVSVYDFSIKGDENQRMAIKRSIYGETVDFWVENVIQPIYNLAPKPVKYVYQLSVGFSCFRIYRSDFMNRYCNLTLKYLPRASCYYLHSPYDFPAIYRACKWHRVPFIYDAHDFYAGMEEEKNLTPFYRRWVHPFLFKLESNCIRNAEAMITVCDGVARLQEETFTCHPIVVRNCHDQRLDKPPQVDLRQLLALSAEDFLIVAIGTAKPGSAIEQSFDAMQKLPQYVHMAFVGKDTNKFIKVIQQRGLEGRVHLLPPVLPTEVVPFVRSADASIILYYARSRHYESALPNGFFQSIAAELPLLYPEIPEVKTIAEHHGLGIPINPLDPDSILSGVIRLISDREQLLVYRRNAHMAKAELGWEEEENKLREILIRILNDKK